MSTQRLICLDVNYNDHDALAAGVVFNAWDDAEPLVGVTERVSPIEPYESGAFYKRELPCLLRVLESAGGHFDVCIVDGYVWLRDQSPGLGAYLYDALNGKSAVVGVAKTSYEGAYPTERAFRGNSAKPLYVTAIGMSAQDAADKVEHMHGDHRIPTLLKRVDRLCRGLSAK